MKILKLLNKEILSIFIIFTLTFLNNLKAEDEPVDIWDLEKKLEDNSSNEVIEIKEDPNESKIKLNIIESSNTKNIIDSNPLEENTTNIVGLYDPEENGLDMDLWTNSDGEEIKSILNKINKINLSKDAKEILEIALLTNSYFPKKNITEEDFINFKLNYLINNNDRNLIKKYLIKNEKNIYNAKLIKFYLNSFLENSDLENVCKIFEVVDYFEDDYISKFKIYCLINENKREEAQLLFDLYSERDSKDEFFENKFNFLMSYIEKADGNILEDNILNFHLSHRTNPEFIYQPSNNTPKFIWKYLSSSNLLEKIDTIDLEDSEKIFLIEKATHEKNYDEKELFELYKRFQFNINQLLNVKDSYKLLKNHEGRALLYQRLILTEDEIQILDLSYKLKDSFIKDNIENAFNSELKRVLSKVTQEQVPSNFSSFYNDNLINEPLEKKNIKINNKIIHQSKLLKYFEEQYDIEKAENDLNKFLKSIKKNKDYKVSTKDLILIESFISDGVMISKKYKNMFELDGSNIPTDIQLLLNNKEVGMVLLRLVKIIGEDDLENLDSDSLYFMISILNELNLDQIRNNFLLKVLPLKI
jgi:hypothetical protein